MKKIFSLVAILFVAVCQAAYDPLALYLTWQRSPDTTMTINWVTPLDENNDTIQYKRDCVSNWQQASGSHRIVSEKDAYLLHRIELVNLFPSTEYIFRIGPDGKEYKFSTMPTLLQETIRFIEGGDMYHDDESYLHRTNQQAAKTNPHFALIGGDIAYADKKSFWFFKLFHDGEDQKFSRWLTWLTAWKEDMVTQDGRLIPLIPAIGNHDTEGHFGQTPEEAPYFYLLFPMPGPQGYNVLDFGNYLSVFILDSGHTHPVGGEQTAWLDKALSDRKNVQNKFALYHVPAFPSVRDDEYCREVRKHWPPVFEKYKLTAAFEHHDHTYKRTHPINGVLYLGDGAWGMKKTRRPRSSIQRPYLAKSNSNRHFILITLSPEKRTFTAISDKGETFDQIEI